jgi:hypothetical protein
MHLQIQDASGVPVAEAADSRLPALLTLLLVLLLLLPLSDMVEERRENQ